MSMNMAQIWDLSSGLFNTADSDDERKREQSLWQLEAAFNLLLRALDRPEGGNNGEVVLNRHQLTEQLLGALDH